MNVHLKTRKTRKTRKARLIGVSLLIILVQACTTNGYVKNKVYVWQSHDSLANLAKRYSTTELELRQLNHIYDTQDLYAGKKIEIPQRKLSDERQTPSKFQPRHSTGQNVFSWPNKGGISSKYGMRNGRMHEGVDLTSEESKHILAATGGIVEFSGWKRGYGRVVILRHKSGFKTLYAHNRANLVSVGARVRGGQKIAVMGSSGDSTGVHLHFEVRRNQKALNPLNHLPPHPKIAAQKK